MLQLPAKAKYTREIGRGSHGIVYRASWNNSTVAIKCIPKRTHRESQWLQEVEMMKATQDIHGLPKFIASEETKDSFCIVMEHIQGTKGCTVLQDVRNGGQVYEETLRVWTKDVVTILQQLHDRDIVYNDIKPSNMLVNYDQAFLVDVGSCRKHTLRKGKPIGSPYYYAPEKFEGYNLMESDVWALGVTLHQFVCGKHPFAPFVADTPRELQTMIMMTPMDLSRDPWDVKSPGLKDFITQLLQKDPSRRMCLRDAWDHPWLEQV